MKSKGKSQKAKKMRGVMVGDVQAAFRAGKVKRNMID